MIKRLVITPFQKFVKVESLSGMLLFGATILALLWANSPWQHLYHSLWQFEFGFSVLNFSLNKPLILWINDGLMTVFFFLIGLELKRELMIGELNSPRKAAFPLFAAIGGMLIPVLLFMVLNKNPETFRGWGIPMAADIAFTLAILNLLGRRIPLSLKVFLTAFAIIDDIGAVTVIALFYSENIDWMLVLFAVLPFALLVWLSLRRIYSRQVFLICAVLIWVLFLKSGIHPTVAGVLLAFTVPIRQKLNVAEYANKLGQIAGLIKPVQENKNEVLSKEQMSQLGDLEGISGKVQSPLQQLEHRLHGWVAYFIVPLFALANAGISFATTKQLEMPLVINTAVCLIVGNFVGVALLSFLSVRFRITQLPTNTNFTHIWGVAFLAGVGFTMSIFIANLAFASDPVYIESAKVGILAGSLFAGICGYTLLRLNAKMS